MISKRISKKEKTEELFSSLIVYGIIHNNMFDFILHIMGHKIKMMRQGEIQHYEQDMPQ